MKEVLEEPDVKKFDEETEVQVTPLAGLVILKLISNYEKPERTRDIEDIFEILINYFDVHQERFYEKHAERADEFSDESFMLDAGAWLAGYDIGKILNKNRQLKKLIMKILQREINTATGNISRYLYCKGYFNNIDTVKLIMELILNGINQK